VYGRASLRVVRFVLSGETVKAKAAYQEFLTLWKDAVPESSILKQAVAEYARLP
jgi:hypothetical protein